MLYLLLAALLALFAGSAPTPTWYFAQLGDNGQIVAFTADGEVRPLINGEAQFGLRVDAQTALIAVAQNGGAAKLYRMTPDKTVSIDLPGSGDAAKFYQALAHSGDYVVLRQQTSALPTEALLINVASAHADVLTGQLPALARFSEDGTLLRYMSANGDQWSLIERTVATGQERVIYQFTPNDPLPSLSPDQYGERWVFTTFDSTKRQRAYRLIARDGSVTALENGEHEDPVQWSFFGDDLVSVPLLCTASCVIRLRSGGAEVDIPLPAQGIYTVLSEPEPGRVLVLKDWQDFWLLDASGQPQPLGHYNPVNIFSSVPQLLSGDGRYVLVATGDTTYGVWDLQARMLVAQATARFAGNVFYSAHGFFLRTYDDPDKTLLYTYADQQTRDLPHTTEGIYFDLLPDGTLLYMLGEATDGIGDPGIYRFDPATQTYTLLVAGAHIFATRPLP